MLTTTTYKAAFYLPPTGNGSGVVLTGPEHEHLTDDELRAEAHAEALRLGLIGADPDLQVDDGTFRDRLQVGPWTGH
jgi:hypothetical protein